MTQIYWRRGCWTFDWVGEGTGEVPDNCPNFGSDLA